VGMPRRTYRGRSLRTSSGRLTGGLAEGSHAKTRRRERVGGRVPQLPKTFCGNEGVLECSGLTELWMEIERVDGKIQSGVKPPQSKKEGSGIFTRRREEKEERRRFPHSPPAPCPRLSTPVSRPNSHVSMIFQLRDLGS
jgi:hypothetical protein